MNKQRLTYSGDIHAKKPRSGSSYDWSVGPFTRRNRAGNVTGRKKILNYKEGKCIYIRPVM